MDTSATGKVEIFGPGKDVVVEELCISMWFCLILVAVIDVFSSDIPLANRPLEDSFQFNNILNGSARSVNSLFPYMFLLTLRGCYDTIISAVFLRWYKMVPIDTAASQLFFCVCCILYTGINDNPSCLVNVEYSGFILKILRYGLHP